MKVKKSNFLICIPHSNLSNICAWGGTNCQDKSRTGRWAEEQEDWKMNREMGRRTGRQVQCAVNQNKGLVCHETNIGLECCEPKHRFSGAVNHGQKNREMHRCTESLSLLPENDHKIPPEKFIIFIVEIKLQSKLTVRFIMRTGLVYVINIT